MLKKQQNIFKNTYMHKKRRKMLLVVTSLIALQMIIIFILYILYFPNFALHFKILNCSIYQHARFWKVYLFFPTFNFQRNDVFPSFGWNISTLLLPDIMEILSYSWLQICSNSCLVCGTLKLIWTLLITWYNLVNILIKL